MSHPFLPILLIFILGATFAGVFMLLSALIGPKKEFESKLLPYECGIDPIGSPREGVDVKFSLVAMLFILFDIEAVFLFPWALLYRDFIASGMGLFMFIEMGIFIFVLAVGLLYVWRKGALDWR